MSTRPRKSRSSSRHRSVTQTMVKLKELTCPICNIDCKDLEEFETHKTAPIHMLNFVKHFLAENKDTFMENKHGVVVSCLEYRNCIPALEIPTAPGKQCSVTLNIENNEEPILFLKYEFLTRMPCPCQLNDPLNVCDGVTAVKLTKSTKYQVTIIFQPNDIGLYYAPLAFMFQKNEQLFYIVRYLEIHCKDKFVESMLPEVLYDPRKPSSSEILKPAATIVKGVKPPRTNSMPTVEVELKKVSIPHSLRDAIQKIQARYQAHQKPSLSNEKNPLIRDLIGIFKNGLSVGDYNAYFRFLLNFEELQMDNDIRKYDMMGVTMRRSGKFSNNLQLNVPGLAEQRPSVVRGDWILVRRQDDHFSGKDIEYQGYVHDINDITVDIGFSNKLTNNFINGLKFNVRFTYNHMPLNAMHRSLSILTKDFEKYILFPTWDDAASCPTIFNPTDRLIMFNRKIEENPEQLTAVKHIVAGSSLPAPYLVHGPPGTGKTVTIVEAIKQVWKLGNGYILVCTPSNSACDLITERLLEHVSPAHILRLYAYSREWKKVPEKIKKSNCCNYDTRGDCFYTPLKEKLMSYRIVLSTLSNATRIVSAGVHEGHFTHVFIDEAGHGLEPETLIAVAGLLKCREPKSKGYGGQLVLAGDPLQLGPVIRCKFAEKYFLGRSLLERLMMTCEVYQRVDGKFDPRVLTRLVRNYRSHPVIVKLPSRLFYDDELEVYADKLERESLCNWEGLPDNEFPILFHGVYGRDLREKQSPSYFNAEEVTIVINYVQKLLEARGGGIKIEQRQIGVITPYRQQVMKIRNQLCNRRYNDVVVGSVDEFQGQERRVIIISTVRSNPDLMAYDSQFKLGFVKNPKRFNVGITRAKSLLIIVGNPKLLALDKHWKELIMYCWKQGSYVGVFYDPPEHEISDVMERMKSMYLVPTLSPQEQELKISQKAQQEDPQWRDDF